jgi:hypothetical protein
MKGQKKESKKKKKKKLELKRKKKKEKRKQQSRCGGHLDQWIRSRCVSWSAWPVRRYARSAWDSQGMSRRMAFRLCG